MVRDAVGRVAVGQVQRHALGVPGEQVGRHAGVDVDRVVEHRAAQLQLRRTGHQFCQLHRPLGRDPPGRVIRFGQGRVLQRLDGDGLPRERSLAQGQRVGRHLQLRIVLAQHQQQLGARHVGVWHDRQRGFFHRWQGLQERGAVVVGGQHHGVLAGQLVFKHRKLVATVTRQHADPACNGARRLERARAGLVAVYKGQADGPVVAWVEERCRQQGQIVAQRDLAQRNFELALIADGRPQARMVGRFAFHRVVADELEAETVVVGEVAWVDVEFDGLWCAQTFLVEDKGLQRFIVEHYLEVRQRRDQCR